jgi:hypothetical protein
VSPGGHLPESEQNADKPTGPQTGCEIILAYFRTRYRPQFRRRNSVIMGVGHELGSTLVAAGLAVKRTRDGAYKLTRSGHKRLAKLMGAASGTIRTVAGGMIRVGGGSARIRS